jgi:uncharacterized glyoxalase superfamily protein PhnB
MRYRDAKRMIVWLQESFGFQPQAVYEDDRGGIAHVQLTLGSGMIMLGSAHEGDDEFGRVQSTPSALGGTTQSPYLVVADADAVYQRAMAAGAEIAIEIKDEDYGGRGFSCHDPEGHLWNVARMTLGRGDPYRPFLHQSLFAITANYATTWWAKSDAWYRYVG